MESSHAGSSAPPTAALLARLLATYRGYVGVVLIYAAFVGLLALITPIAVQTLVNTVAHGFVLQPLVVLVLVLALALSLSGAGRALKLWVSEVLQRRMFVDSLGAVAARLPVLDWQRAERERGSHLETRFFELFTLQKTSAALLLGAVDLLLTLLFGLLVLAFYHPALLAFAALLLFFVLLLLSLGRGATASSIRESSAKFALLGHMSDCAERARRGELLPGDQTATALDALGVRWLEARSAHFRVVYRQHVGALVMQAGASALLLALGGLLVLQKQLTLGQLVAAELIVTTVLSALSNVGKHFETYYDLITALYKLGSLVDAPARDERGRSCEETFSFEGGK